MDGWKSIRISVPIDGGIPAVSGDMGTFMPILANIAEGGQYKIGDTIYGGLGRDLVVEVLREENQEEVIFVAVVFYFVVCLIFHFFSFRLVRRFLSSRHKGLKSARSSRCR